MRFSWLRLLVPFSTDEISIDDEAHRRWSLGGKVVREGCGLKSRQWWFQRLWMRSRDSLDDTIRLFKSLGLKMGTVILRCVSGEMHVLVSSSPVKPRGVRR